MVRNMGDIILKVHRWRGVLMQRMKVDTDTSGPVRTLLLLRGICVGFGAAITNVISRGGPM